VTKPETTRALVYIYVCVYNSIVRNIVVRRTGKKTTWPHDRATCNNNRRCFDLSRATRFVFGYIYVVNLRTRFKSRARSIKKIRRDYVGVYTNAGFRKIKNSSPSLPLRILLFLRRVRKLYTVSNIWPYVGDRRVVYLDGADDRL